MQRKINRVAKNTLTISLPAKWVKKKNLKQGDVLEVYEDESKMILSTEKYSQEKIVRIEAEKESIPFMRSIIGRHYKHGATQIDIKFKEKTDLKEIRKAVNNLMGADITEIEETRCRIRIFSLGEDSYDYMNLFTKMLITIKHMISVINDFNEEYFRELRDANWKLKDYCIRQNFLKGIEDDMSEPLFILLFLYEKIGTALFKYIRFSKIPIDVSDIKKIQSHIDIIIKIINRKSNADEESKFRKQLKAYQEKALDKSPIIYTTTELLDSSISYISMLNEE